MNKKKLLEFESIICYKFEDKTLLIQALTHSSYANENNMKKKENNERLEFLGDAVLEIITSDYLYKKYPNKLEGELTKMRASIVCEPTLAEFSREINLGEYVLLGKGEDSTGGRSRESLLSDATEAIIGAIFLDGGVSAAKDFVEKGLLYHVENKIRFFDSKTKLQEHIQKYSDEPVEYNIVEEEGPDHNKKFIVEARHEGKRIGIGQGKSKKSAEQKAAYDSLKKFKK